MAASASTASAIIDVTATLAAYENRHQIAAAAAYGVSAASAA